MTEQAGEALLYLTIGDGVYALPVSQVVRVLFVRRDEIYPVPFDGAGRLRGLFHSRGEVVALARQEGLETRHDREGNDPLTAAILQWEGRPFALLIDRAESDPPPGVQPVGLDVRQLYTGAARHDH